MPTLSQRLRQLDRRVMQEDRLRTAEGWTLAMSRWKYTLAFAILEAVVGVTLVALPAPGGFGGIPLAFFAVWMAFNAGQMKVEHERICGRETVFGKRRQPGL